MANETIQANDGGKEPKQQLNIAFLECDEPAEPTLRKHGGFHDMLHKLLEPLMDIEHGHIKLKVHAFDPVYKRQYPTREQLEHVDCVCISGSFVEYAGVDTPWITRLLGYVIYLHDEFPRIRLIGICFGHQIIARAFGAQVATEGYGWEIGSTPLYLTDEGKKLLCPPKDQRDVLRIQQMHSDVITNVPEGFKLLAWSDKTPVQSLVKYYDKNQLDEMEDPPEYVHGERRPPKPYSMIHILTCQGHAEWGPEVIDPLVDEFLKDGKITEEIAKEAKSKTKEKDDAEMFARAFLRQMGLILQDTKKQIEQHNGH